MAAADAMGLLVLDENRHFGIQPGGDILPDNGVPAAWAPQNLADFEAVRITPNPKPRPQPHPQPHP